MRTREIPPFIQDLFRIFPCGVRLFQYALDNFNPGFCKTIRRRVVWRRLLMNDAIVTTKCLKWAQELGPIVTTDRHRPTKSVEPPCEHCYHCRCGRRIEPLVQWIATPMINCCQESLSTVCQEVQAHMLHGSPEISRRAGRRTRILGLTGRHPGTHTTVFDTRGHSI